MIGSVRDVFENYDHGMYDNTVKGRCSCCGDCCSNRLPMNQEEIKEIKYYIKLHDIKPTIRKSILDVRPVLDLRCPFLDETKELKCKIYPVRPQICREFICNVGREFVPSKEVLDGRHHNVNVRETFFSKE